MFQDMDDSDIRDLFSPFGEIKKMQLTKDDVSNVNKGNAFIEYSEGWKLLIQWGNREFLQPYKVKKKKLRTQ